MAVRSQLHGGTVKLQPGDLGHVWRYTFCFNDLGGGAGKNLPRTTVVLVLAVVAMPQGYEKAYVLSRFGTGYVMSETVSVWRDRVSG